MAGALALCTLSLASAKTYEITLANPSKAGTADLKAGQYLLKINGNNATFVKVDGGKNVTVPVKVVNGEKKFETTTVDAAKEGDTQVIKDVELGGSKTQIVF